MRYNGIIVHSSLTKSNILQFCIIVLQITMNYL